MSTTNDAPNTSISRETTRTEVMESTPQSQPRANKTFFTASPASRAGYLKGVAGGVFMLAIVIFGLFAIYWGALYKSPKPLPGWVVDFDGGQVGSTVTNALPNIPGLVKWSVKSASDFAGGNADLANAVREEKVWVAIAVNANATQKLSAATQSLDASYNGTSAITVYGVEARQETVYRNFLRPSFQGALDAISSQFAAQYISRISNVSAVPNLAIKPIGYTTDNLIPFDVPVATAVTFVGLIYLVILTFFILNMTMGIRMQTGLEFQLSTRSLITLRLVTVFLVYFLLSLFITLLDRAFQAPLDRKFGNAGFVVLWMVNYLGMLALGLALESMVTLLTMRFVPFFMIMWIILNIAVAATTPEVQPSFYHYGYAMPFYNVSKAVRTVVFGTHNNMGMNCGILIAWIVISICSLSIFQVLMRQMDARSKAKAAQNTAASEEKKEENV